MSYHVSAPLVIAKDDDGRDVYLYEGATVPDNVKGEQLKRFEEDGMIAKGDGPVAGDGAGSEAPAKSANKADWVDYAVSQGADREQAEASTKGELVERYGD